MTYNELSAIIDRMTDEEKEKDVSIFDDNIEEIYPLKNIVVPSDNNPDDTLIIAITEDVLDKGTPIIVF